MGSWLSEREQRLVAGAETASAATPGADTDRVERRVPAAAPERNAKEASSGASSSWPTSNGKRLGLSRRQFLQTGCGMAAAFLAMNEVYGGGVFGVDAAEAREPELTRARAERLAGQFIFDVQTHFVRDDFNHPELLDLAKFAGDHWNPALKGDTSSLVRFKFQNYLKEVYYDSDTSMALLSGAPFDDPTWWLLSNEQIVRAREVDQRLRRIAAAPGAHGDHAQAARLDGRGRQGDRAPTSPTPGRRTRSAILWRHPSSPGAWTTSR